MQPDHTRLANRHILITGGGTGIGFACAAHLRNDGAVVTLMGRRRNKLEEAKAALETASGPDVRIAAGDVANEDDVIAAVNMLPSTQAAPCTAASLQPERAPSARSWTRDAGAVGQRAQHEPHGHHAHAQARRPRDGRRRRIDGRDLSIAGILTHRWMTPYCVSKAAIEMLVRNAADELGGAGVRVNAVRPGLVPTDLAAGLVNNPQSNADYLDQMPLRRLGTTGRHRRPLSASSSALSRRGSRAR